MEVTSINIAEIPKLNVDIDETLVRDVPVENSESEKEKTPVENDIQPINSKIDYDDEEDSGDDIAVITKTSNGIDSSPAKNMFSIKTVSNVQTHNNYKISKTAIDLEHPGNINGVPTVDYDLSKLNDDSKPWKKPGADVSDFFNYGFTEDTWLMYCEKQKALRLSQDNSALKTLSGLSNFGYNLSGSHIHLGFNRNNNGGNNNTKPMKGGGLIDVIGGCQQSMGGGGGGGSGGGGGDFKGSKMHGDLSGKISTIPVQTATGGGHMGLGPGQAGNYMTGLANQALSNNLLNPLMSALAMGMLPNGAMLANHHQQNNGPMDGNKLNHQAYGGQMDGRNFGNGNNQGGSGWGNCGNNAGNDFERHNSVDSMHSHEDYGERKSYVKSDRGARRNDYEESRRHRSRDRREKSTERRRRSRSRSRDHAHESKHSRSSKRQRSPEENRRHKKHSRDRSRDRGGSSDDDGSSKRHRRHRSPKRTRRSKSRSHDDGRKDRHSRRHNNKSPADEAGAKHSKTATTVATSKKDEGDKVVDNIKREKETMHAD